MQAGEAEAWREGHRILAERIAGLPAALREAALPAPPLGLAADAVEPCVTTGIGSSAAHARLLAYLLAAGGLRARFRPLSAFAGARGGEDGLLVVFSQGLSPNARLALEAPGRRRALLVTAASAAAASTVRPGLLVRRFPGEDEYGTLLRVTGPACGIVAAIALAREILAAAGARDAIPPANVDDVCRAMDEAARRALEATGAAGLPDDVAFLASGDYAELAGNLPAKILEGTFRPLPPVFDLLETAHGPFQQARGREVTWLALARREAGAERELLARLRAMLDPSLHRLVELESRLPAPWALLEHEAAVNALVLRDIETRRIDQVRWPGRGADHPLYALGGREPETRRLDALTWPEIGSLLASGCRTVVVPLGATEQHGPHLPLATDSTIAAALAGRLCARVPEALAAPVVALGCSAEHLDFPGTASVRASTLAALLEDLLRSLRRHGFGRAFLFSAHGGNFGALREALPGLRRALAPMAVDAFTDLDGLTAALHETAASLGVPAAVAGHHAGEVETSILLALDPLAVRRHALAEGRLVPETGAQPLFYPRLRPNAPDGTVGDPRAADAARAEAYLARWVDLLAAALAAG